MKNQEIADIFRQIAQILEIMGENHFRIRAYERAAQNIESMPEDIEIFIKEDRVTTIPGIGKDLEQKIKEIVSEGRLQYLEDLKKDIPKGLLDILAIPGVGPKTAKLLYEKLDIRDVVMLERMAHAGRIRELPGMKQKTEENILRGIEILKRGHDRMDLKTAQNAALSFVSELKRLKEVKRIDPAGSLRRGKDTVRDIDILISSNSPEKVMGAFTESPQVKEVIVKGPTKSSILSTDDINVDVRVIKDDSYGAALLYFTGSKEHNIRLRQLAIKKGLKLSEYGIFRKNKRIAGKTEIEMYKKLGLPYIEPELREARGEIEAASEDKLPDLIELKDIKGDLHAHSTWSDGGSSMEEVVKKAKDMGYEYIAITDHSQGLKIARGLDRRDLKNKKKEMNRLSKKYKGIKILFGTEVDIDSEGMLDYPDDILREMDIVIGAIHSGFKQPRERLTKRITAACKNKYVHIIAHPTGKLWGAREAYEVDFEEVFRVAADTGTAIEINSYPQRLDLNDIYSRMAKEAGVKLAINTDAHIAEELDNMKFGVSVGRRAWLEKKDVINTLGFGKLRTFLKKKSS
ncbi:MAG: DNA polymerase/3'-5' exonuclease PolX [Candidatus Omnitrophica bacterium]|nr:DNA polymerase/3'-5' exonuclease PolX [Candidatus Omnitrophota bacterium]